MQMLWTAEAVEELKRLALEGRSASVIAATLGVGSRNAVIGKANRIGIKLNGDGRVPAAGATPRARAQWAVPRVPGAKRPPAALARRPERNAAWALGEVEIGEMRRLRFEDIREFTCRWPLGDPKAGDFAYCGLAPASGQSYCAGHCRMAYRPPQPGQRAGERQGRRAIGNSWRLS
jgi:GcrA cell cycle regulator